MTLERQAYSPERQTPSQPQPETNGYKEHLPPRIVLSAENMTIAYGNKDAVKNVNLQIPEHQIMAIIGPSGCGKSTVLRAFNRMNDLIPGARLREGKVMLGSKDLYASNIDTSAVRQNVGFVAQRPQPLIGDILYNVTYAYTCLGVKDKKLLRAVAEECLKKAYLWDEVKNNLKGNPTKLSGGQQQRLCIARALASPAKILLMDEPCSALDPIATQAIEDLMVELKQTHTIVIVTHNMQQAQRIADRTAFFNVRRGPEEKGKENRWGELVEEGPTGQIFSAPQFEETRQYVRGEFG